MSDLKQSLKEKARRRLSISSKNKQKLADVDTDIDEVTQNVNVQVRQREPSSPEKSRSKLDLLREQTSGAIREGLDNLKRPLTGLLRRPGSRSGSKERPPAASQAFVETSPNNKNNGNVTYSDRQEASSTATKKKIPTESSWLSSVRPGSSAGNRISGGKQAALAGVVGEKSGDNDESLVTTTMVESSAIAKDTPDDPMANLEELRSVEFGLSIAQAPNIAVNTVSSYQDLDHELSSNSQFQSLDGIDLSLLSKCLCPEHEVKDEQVPWTWDYLYTTVCGELRQEWQQQNGRAGDATETD